MKGSRPIRSTEFEKFQTSLAIPDSIRSFDLTFFSGGTLAATGLINIDDISVSVSEFDSLAADFDKDNDVDGADFLVWQRTLGDIVAPGTAADGDGSGVIDSGDLDVWKTGFGSIRGPISAARVASEQVPEPSSLLMLGIVVTAARSRARARRAGD